MIIFACSKKNVATQEVTTNTPRETSLPEIPKSNTDATTDVSLTAAGKSIYETKCTRCHGMKPVTSYTTYRWDGILKLMAPKAKLTETEIQQVTAYVKSNAKSD
jgi:mono/diheme cytochrome c family protein